MADVTVVGSGRCPKCDGTTEIKSVDSWPFPEDEQHWTTETCTMCDFEIRRNFSSTDATTSIEHERSESTQKAKVAIAILSVTAFHLSGDVSSDLAAIRSILTVLENEDFSLLYVEIMKSAPSTEVRGLVKAVETARRKNA